MLTIFTMPKAFRGHAGIIQKNAIRSWLQLRPACDIILLGDDEGTAEAAAELSVRHAPDIERNKYGTPLISSIYTTGQKLAKYDTVCHINADIILMSDFLPAISQVHNPSFLAIGRRWDMDITEPINFDEVSWEEQLRASMVKEGRLHGESGIDYFIFPRGMFRDVPPFAIGRGGWDNWLIYKARVLGVPVIDATAAITIVHQNHDYSHTVTGVWLGPERQLNRQYTRYGELAFSLTHSTLLLTPRGMKRPFTLSHLYAYLSSQTVLHPALHFLSPVFKAIVKLVVLVKKPFRRNSNIVAGAKDAKYPTKRY